MKQLAAVAVLIALVLCVPVEAQTPEIDALRARAEQGVAVHEIQHLLGHASLVTTQRYLNATEEALRRSVKVLEQQVG